MSYLYWSDLRALDGALHLVAGLRAFNGLEYVPTRRYGVERPLKVARRVPYRVCVRNKFHAMSRLEVELPHMTLAIPVR